ncbi:MAG: RsiV family protein [Acinetobacter sp.]
MMMQYKKSVNIFFISTLLGLTACQDSSKTQTSENKQNTTESKANPTAQVALITARTVAMPLKSAVVCESDECTRYELATVKTNFSWINDYFSNRLTKDAPLAFKSTTSTQATASQPVQASEPANMSEQTINQNQYKVRYLGQYQNLASFVIDSYTYNAGAAHGLYHHEYVVFDLKQKRRIMVDDLFAKDQRQAVVKALYENNEEWLRNHDITPDKFDVSDNFYYGVHGIVFVYPLYELASYAEGMSELTLPYEQAELLLKTDYLPE